MKLMPEVIEAMIRAGYRPPEDNPLACRNCPSVSRKQTTYRYWLRVRHEL